MSNKMKKKQIENQTQQGRSMVEMLGVLAIVGVLSIGGIAGYSWGMDKHVANQILYEMNLNSAQLAMLLQKGNPEGVTLSLGSPYDDENPTFSTVNYGFDYGCGENDEEHKCAPNETMYSMTAIGLPKRVCNMLNDSVFGMAYYYNHTINGDENNKCDDEAEGNTVTVFFETDTMIDGEISRPEEPVTHTPTPEVTTTTTTPQTTTPPATTPEATTTQVTTTTEATTTTTTTTTATPTTLTPTTIVTTTTQPKSCDDLHCGADEFCLSTGCYSGYSCPEGMNCDGNGYVQAILEESGCSYYSCKKISEYKAVNKDAENPDKYVMSKDGKYMNWWSAERFCKAQHRNMVEISDLNCWNTSLGGTTTGYCGKDGDLGSELSEVVKALRKAENGTETSGSHGYWLSDPFTSIDADNSYYAYHVDLSGGFVVADPRNAYTSFYALCK